MSSKITPITDAAEPSLLAPDGGRKGAAVAERIRVMIIQDELPPGAPVRERALAERLEVSRTPLREAIKILSAEGLVEVQPHRGAVVADPSNEELRGLVELLGVLEAFAAELACRNRTDAELQELRALQDEMMAAYARDDRLGYFRCNQAIHLAIVKASRNRALIHHHGVVNARLYRARYICNLRTRRWASALQEHEDMLQALEARDEAKISGILRNHVLQAWDKMVVMLEEAAANLPRRRAS
ncbi:MAG TPA: GntR family transcriptional regulator [Kiloniellales bacterium]|nr:GntR family transcriptional regulator [Kiloniellales bacterium]